MSLAAIALDIANSTARLRSADCSGMSRSCSQNWERLETAAERLVCGYLKPLCEHGCVNAPEVGGGLDVAVCQIGKAGGRSDQAGCGEMGSGEEYGSRRAVVGAGGAVLGGSSAELAERHQQHAVPKAGGFEVVGEGLDSARELAEQFF